MVYHYTKLENMDLHLQAAKLYPIKNFTKESKKDTKTNESQLNKKKINIIQITSKS